MPQHEKLVFISYTGADVAWARWVVWHLDAAGYEARYQERDFRTGRSFMQEIHQALSAATTTVALLSPAYLEAPYCTAEWTAALAQDPTNANGRLVPVRIVPCQPIGLLAPLAYVDLVTAATAAVAAARLLDGVAASAAGSPDVEPRASDMRRQPLFPPDRLRVLTWRLVRTAVVGVLVTVSIWQMFQHVIASWMMESPTKPSAAAVVCGLVAAGIYFCAERYIARRREGQPR